LMKKTPFGKAEGEILRFADSAQDDDFVMAAVRKATQVQKPHLGHPPTSSKRILT
jgi:hypothetical protein